MRKIPGSGLTIRRNPVKRLLATALLAVLPFAPVQAADDAAGAWAVFSTAGKLGERDDGLRWLYAFDAQARYPDIGSGANQYLLRPAIGFSRNERLSYWFGYARFRTRGASGNVVDENRYWQQVQRAATPAGFSWRLRVEERFVSNSDETGLVLRLQGKLVRPLGDRSRHRVFFGIEPFIKLRDTDWAGDTGFAQNRLFAGIGWRISDSLVIETSYMNQYLWRPAGPDRSNHLLVVNFRKSFRGRR